MEKKVKIFIAIVGMVMIPLLSEGVSVGSTERFFIEEEFDAYDRGEANAELVKVTDYIHFYVDRDWWGDASEREKEDYKKSFRNLSGEFEENIRPEMASRFGNEPKHTVSPDEHITLLFHPMEENAGGYFRSGDQYSRYQYSKSNERNIIYLSSNIIRDSALPGYFSHEYTHLVTFNEKNREHGVNEEIWLNELRAEVIPTLLGYDDVYEESNLRLRKQNFLRDPDMSLTEWTEQAADYGVINLFGQYLVDHYGEEVIADSLQSEFVGIPSIDHALSGKEKRFSQIFTDWTIATYLNDCSLGEYYCYKNDNLEDMQVSPTTYFLPTKNEEFFVTEYRTKNWAGNWHRIVGGSGTLYLEFEGDSEFVVPYVLCEKQGECKVYRMEIEDKKGELIIEEFNTTYESITIIPSLQQKFEGFNGPERTHSFRWRAKIVDDKEVLGEEKVNFDEIRERLAIIREGVLELYELAGLSLPKEEVSPLKKDLYFGMTGSEEVRNLQRFLKKQEKEIYPEGYVTGNFYNLTKEAVIRFQEKHAKYILEPLGLTSGTGYVGNATRRYINDLITK